MGHAESELCLANVTGKSVIERAEFGTGNEV